MWSPDPRVLARGRRQTQDSVKSARGLWAQRGAGRAPAERVRGARSNRRAAAASSVPLPRVADQRLEKAGAQRAAVVVPGRRRFHPPVVGWSHERPGILRVLLGRRCGGMYPHRGGRRVTAHQLVGRRLGVVGVVIIVRAVARCERPHRLRIEGASIVRLDSRLRRAGAAG